MFRRLSRGLRDLTGNTPRPPGGSAPKRGGVQQGAGASQQRSFLRRVGVGRRGVKQEEAGPSALEQRAAQDVDGTLAERIVVEELRRRKIAFDFQQYEDGSPLVVYGQRVDFLLIDADPQIVLDVFSDYHAAPWGVPWADFTTIAAIEGHGLIYEALWDQIDIFPSALILELRLDQILGRRATQSMTPPAWSGVPED